MEGWTTPKQVSAAMLIMAFASFPQILSVARSEWSQSLDIAIAFFSIGIPLNTGYFLPRRKWQARTEMGGEICITQGGFFPSG